MSFETSKSTQEQSNGLNQGLVIAAPASGSGKTVVTLALLRALARRNIELAPAKLGPDYIDPAFHAMAAGESSLNLDPWAMSDELLLSLAQSRQKLLIAESMMGLFDGASDGKGSAADFAVKLQLPVLLVVDVSKQGHSVAALVRGFLSHRPDVKISGLILNKVGSPRHQMMLNDALSDLDVPVLGYLPRDTRLELPERHLGLVQVGELERPDLFFNHAADVIEDYIDLKAIIMLAQSGQVLTPSETPYVAFKPPGQRISIARDAAFAFSYEHILQGWKQAGAELRFFSPLADEAPHKDADFIYLPGGYPELHAAKLASNRNFMAGLQRAALNIRIYGECGGYMVLGECLIDKDGQPHKMAGLLPVETSFEHRKLHLGYRKAILSKWAPFFANLPVRAHEFHYTHATKLKSGCQPLFTDVRDARGETLSDMGQINSLTCGSYLHLICGAEHG